MEKNWKLNTSIFLGSQAISLFGSMLVQYAIAWHINLTTGSGLYVTLAVLFGFVPTFLLSPFAGVWADRYNRRLLIVLADGGIALATLILAFVVRSGVNSLTPLFIALAIRSLGAAVQNPCVGAILPSIVPEEHLTKVNGINSSIQASITVFSPILAAMLIIKMPFYSIFFIDVITAAAAIAIMLFVFKYKHVEKPEITKNDYLGELKLGFRYVASRRYLKIFFTGLFVINFLVAPVAFLTPLQITRNYGADEIFLMWYEVVFSAGMILGGLLIAAWGGFKNRVHTMILTGIVMSSTVVMLGIRMAFVPYLIVCFFCGLVLPGYNTPATVLLQERVEDEYRGRVFSVLTMLSNSALPLGMLFFGPLGDAMDIEYLLLISGALMLATVVFLLTRKPLLEAGMPVVRLEVDGGDAPSTGAEDLPLEGGGDFAG